LSVECPKIQNGGEISDELRKKIGHNYSFLKKFVKKRKKTVMGNPPNYLIFSVKLIKNSVFFISI
jgi:hypothetical protein